jgi:hypothetical protein
MASETFDDLRYVESRDVDRAVSRDVDRAVSGDVDIDMDYAVVTHIMPRPMD